MDWLVLAKVAAIYFFILLVLKFMGKREIGQLDLFDFVVILIIADIASIGVEEGSNFFITLLAIVLLAIIQKVLAFLLLRIPKLRDVIDGKQSVIMIEGKINIKEMRKQKYNIDDFVVQARLKNVRSLSEIRFAILEANGEISIFKYSDYEENNSNSNNSMNNVTSKSANPITNNKSGKRIESQNAQKDDIYPFPLIISGIVNQDNMRLLKLTEKWLEKEILKQGYQSYKEIYYANYENDKLFIVQTCDF